MKAPSFLLTVLLTPKVQHRATRNPLRTLTALPSRWSIVRVGKSL